MENLNTTRGGVYIVDASRTPFLKARNKPGPFSASDLAVASGRDLLLRQPFSAEDIDDVIIGCTMASADEANIARIIALRLGCGDQVPGWTVQRNCASGMQAVDCAFQSIADGRHDLVLAGGTEAMSRAPLLFKPAMAAWLGGMYAARSLPAKLQQIVKFRPHFLTPIIALLRGLTDPVVGLNMGQTAENVAYRFGITRQAMDEFAAESHQRVLTAQTHDHFAYITPLFDTRGHAYQKDDGVREDSTPERLAKLRPVFDKKYGAVTAGNSSQITDGAALLILASEQAVKRYELKPIARIVDVHWAALDPAEMGLGPVYASTPLLQRHGLTLDDIDYWEINEAFAAQVLGCLAAWQDDRYCEKHFGGLAGAYGAIKPESLNIDGGAIALGHPIGASGARLIMQLAHILQRQEAKRGIATLCIGGGQGGAVLIERV